MREKFVNGPFSARRPNLAAPSGRAFERINPSMALSASIGACRCVERSMSRLSFRSISGVSSTQRGGDSLRELGDQRVQCV